MARSLTRLAALACVALASTSARAYPDDGEGRSLLRDLDHPYTDVAGEADATSVVINPAKLGMLRGLSATGELVAQDARPLRRGTGFGLFLAYPVALRRLLGPTPLFTLGLGYQYLFPWAAFAYEDGGDGRTTDLGYHKVSLALSVPLTRWIPGLSLGLTYHRLWSLRDPYAQVGQLDVGVSYWVSRHVALGLVGRGINMPASGDPEGRTSATPVPVVRQVAEIDPELAIRPLGTPALELGLGARVMPYNTAPRFTAYPVQPRARLLAGVRGVRVYVEAEGYRHMLGDVTEEAVDRWALRVHAGVALDLGNFGITGGPTFGTVAPAVQGVSLRVRGSLERYRGLALRPREVLELSVRGVDDDAELLELLQRFEERARGVILLDARGLALGWAQIEELRAAIGRFRTRGGKVVVYLRGANLQTMFLAAAADRILAHPHGRLATVGLNLEVFYFADLLGRLGARPEFVRIAEYKGRPEQLHQMAPSAEVRSQRALLLEDLWRHVVGAIAVDRKVAPAAVTGWIDAAPHSADDALRRGMIDGIAQPDALEEALEAWLDRPVKLRAPKDPTHLHDYGKRPAIAVLHVHGVLRSGKSLYIPLLDRHLTGDRTVVPVIEKLARDRTVKAVVVRIDSIGGSVACAEAITRALEQLADKKPVIVSMGDDAASGGYYIATAGETIFTDMTTRTGSIGVFLAKVDLSGVLEKFGVAVDAVRMGQNAGLYSWWKPYSDSELAAATRGIQASYDTFVERVAESRGLTPQAVDALARGRVWSGSRALERGLADRPGGLVDAIEFARARVQLSARRSEVRVYPDAPGLLDQLGGLFGVSMEMSGESGHTGGPPTDARELAAAAARARLGPLLDVLQRLPAVFWLSASAEPLALATEQIAIE
ncbi:MAG: signal peptide peptidase SppA [Myxococcales bacterium]|nr:signal peptide peptidase SppA [Myxococcales bacterium]